MKKKTIWYLVAALILGLALLAVACSSPAPVTPAAPEAPATPVTPVAPATPVTPVEPVTPVAPATPAAPVAPAATPPKAPKALHEALFAADPPACTGCHIVGAAGVGVAGGTGLPGPEAGANDHTDRTKATPLLCKTCHQLSS